MITKLITASFFFALVASSYSLPAASINANAIGLRSGGGSAFGAEISYQMAMGSANRLEADIGWSAGKYHSWLGLAGIYHWAWNIHQGLNWFAGPGAQAGFWSHDDDGSGIALGIGGQIGIEYDFNVHGAPIQLGLDIRPMFGFINNGGFGGDGALSVRYTF